MFDQADHYEFLERVAERPFQTRQPEMDEDELMDAEHRAEEAERTRDGLREDGIVV